MVDPKAPAGFIGNTRKRKPMEKGWQTPFSLLWPSAAYWGGQIPFDVCSVAGNPTCALRFWTPKDDALSRPWPDQWFCNPPYGTDLQRWLPRAIAESKTGSEGIVVCSAARWEQEWFQDAMQDMSLICFVRGRVAYIRPTTGRRVNGNTYATMCLGLGIRDETRWLQQFNQIGACVRMVGLTGAPPQTAHILGKRLKKIGTSRVIPELLRVK